MKNCEGKAQKYPHSKEARECHNPAIVERDGVAYCWTHDPERVSQTTEERRRTYPAQLSRVKERYRRLSRYDEAIRLLRRLSLIIGGRFPLHHAEVVAFLDAEPSRERGIQFEEITPEEAQRRYLRSMKSKP